MRKNATRRIEILFVNVRPDVDGGLRRDLSSVLRWPFRVCSYLCGGATSNRPRMKPCAGRNGRVFDFVVVDVGPATSWEGIKLAGASFPTWFKADMLRELASSDFLILFPHEPIDIYLNLRVDLKAWEGKGRSTGFLPREPERWESLKMSPGEELMEFSRLRERRLTDSRRRLWARIEDGIQRFSARVRPPKPSE